MYDVCKVIIMGIKWHMQVIEHHVVCIVIGARNRTIQLLYFTHTDIEDSYINCDTDTRLANISTTATFTSR